MDAKNTKPRKKPVKKPVKKKSVKRKRKPAVKKSVTQKQQVKQNVKVIIGEVEKIKRRRRQRRSLFNKPPPRPPQPIVITIAPTFTQPQQRQPVDAPPPLVRQQPQQQSNPSLVQAFQNDRESVDYTSTITEDSQNGRESVETPPTRPYIAKYRSLTSSKPVAGKDGDLFNSADPSPTEASSVLFTPNSVFSRLSDDDDYPVTTSPLFASEETPFPTVTDSSSSVTESSSSVPKSSSASWVRGSGEKSLETEFPTKAIGDVKRYLKKYGTQTKDGKNKLPYSVNGKYNDDFKRLRNSLLISANVLIKKLKIAQESQAKKKPNRLKRVDDTRMLDELN